MIALERVRDEPWTPVPAPTTGPAPLTLLCPQPAGPQAVRELLSAAERRSTVPVQVVVVAGPVLGGPVISIDAADRPAFLGWLRASTALVWMEAEDPPVDALLAAMALDVPILALDSPANRAALGRAGALLKERDPGAFASLAVLVGEDRSLRRAILETQRPSAARGPRFQIEGPFDTSYSLAAVNRELGLALERRAPGSVALFSTEGPGDFQPHPSMSQYDGVEALWRRARKGSGAPAVVRNLYPPRVADMDGRVNVLYFAWEESSVPGGWVDGFNRHLDGMCVLSRFVKKALVDSGVSVSVSVGGCGIDQVTRPERLPYPGELGKRFRFLHVSSAFPRKGVDALLKAYTTAFSDRDDVSLVLKTFPNPHNTVRQQVAEARARPGCPDIVLIDEDLDPGQLVDLYRRCHAFVAPSRGEGFGLPMAEAMHFGLPVIATGHGGHLDFCTPETAWLVDFTFARVQSHFGQNSSVWADPDVADLARAMRDVVSKPLEAQARARKAKELVDRELRWDRCAARLEEAVDQLAGRRRPARGGRPLRVAWVSSWNARCGIASYSRYLVDRLAPVADVQVLAARAAVTTAPDEPSVTRCWAYGEPLEELERALERAAPDVAVFQFAFGFYDFPQLARLLERLRRRGVATVITLHATRDVDEQGWKRSLRDLLEPLRGVDRLLVHSVPDLNRLKALGLVDNVALVPQGVLRRPEADHRLVRAELGLPADAEIVASYGFLLPPKGIEELVSAFPAIAQRRPRAALLLANAIYPVPASSEVRDRVRALIQSLGAERRVALIDEYLTDDQSLALLEASDLIVYPYQRTGESASAAVRFGLASGRPVAVTPLEIFSDVAGAVHHLPGTAPAELAEGICGLLEDRRRLEATAEAQRAWLAEHDWDRIATRLLGLLQALVGDAAELVTGGRAAAAGEAHG